MAEGSYARNLMLRAVLFDLDGTLLDTLDDLTGSVNAALRRFGYPARTKDEVCRFVGNGVRKLMERAVPAGCTDFPAVYEAFRQHYSAHCCEKTRPYPGIPEMLKAIQHHGLQAAICSNKMDAAVSTLREKFFAPWIQVAVGDSPYLEKKPAPDLLYSAMGKLGVLPDEVIYVGDSDVDLETAKNAGVPCVSVTWGFRDETFLCAHGATALAADPGALLRLLLSEIV